MAGFTFVLGNQPGPVVNVKPGVLCDLGVTVRLSRWPSGIQKLLLAPVHAEPFGVLDAPSFTFTPPSAAMAESPLTLNSRGRLLIRSAQHAMARPIQVKYQMLAVDGDGQDDGPSEGRVVASVLGQPELSIESFDPSLNPLTGFRQVDDRLAELRLSIRGARLSDVEQSHFVKIHAAASAIAAQALSDSLYPDRLAEADFQTSFRDRLRGSPSIGGELEGHPQAAGGITDLSFHKIRVELKVSDTAGIDCRKALEEHGQQLQQYVVGSDRHSGLLVVLDNAPKNRAPSSVANDLDVFAVSPENGGGLPLLVGVVVVRGRLKQPSQLGRQKGSEATAVLTSRTR